MACYEDAVLGTGTSRARVQAGAPPLPLDATKTGRSETVPMLSGALPAQSRMVRETRRHAGETSEGTGKETEMIELESTKESELSEEEGFTVVDEPNEEYAIMDRRLARTYTKECNPNRYLKEVEIGPDFTPDWARDRSLLPMKPPGRS